MTPKEFIDENYFSLTLDCKREINEIYQALEDYAEAKQLTIPVVVKSLPSKDEILLQARKVENYIGDEMPIAGAEKSGKFHGFLKGVEWLSNKLVLSGVSTRFLPFDNIAELIRKVDKIREAHGIKSETFRGSLKERGIIFTEIDDYGVAIDIAQLNETDIDFIKNQDDSLIEKVYEENGVVLNVCQR